MKVTYGIYDAIDCLVKPIKVSCSTDSVSNDPMHLVFP